MVLLKTTIRTVRMLLQYNQISKKMVGHFPDLFATILFPFFKREKILEIKLEVLGEKRTAPQST